MLSRIRLNQHDQRFHRFRWPPPILGSDETEKVLEGIKGVPGRDFLGFTLNAEREARYNRVGLPLLVKAKIRIHTL